jgi:hypothetical protein
LVLILTVNQAAQKGDQGEAGQWCPHAIQGRVMSQAIAATTSSAESAQHITQVKTFGWTSSGLGRALAAFWRELTRDAVSPYRPEKHYMRGPGPAWQAKYGTFRSSHAAD